MHSKMCLNSILMGIFFLLKFTLMVSYAMYDILWDN